MAYDSSRNYLQEIRDIIQKNGDPAKVNQLLNERLEKQQSMETGTITYDDGYREAMDYMASKGYTPKASANVDYYEVAGQILLDQIERGVSDDFTSDRSHADLATVADARQKKLDTGKYDEWADATIGDSGIALNGENSIHQMYKDYATYTQQMQDYYQQAADILRGSGGGYGGGSYGGGGYSGGYGGSYPSGGGSGGSGGGTAVLAPVKTGPTTYTSGTDPVQLGLTESAWEQKQNRDAARDAVAVTNAATRVPVQGEMSSYVKGTTQDAFDQAVQALLAEGDKDGALALRQAQAQYESTGKMNIQMPEPKGDLMEGTYVYSSGTPSRIVRPSTGGGVSDGTVELVPEDPLYPGVPNVQTGGGTVSAGSGAAGSKMTDAEMDAILAELGFSNVPVFSFAGTTFDNTTLGSQMGDTAVQQAARILSGGGGNGTQETIQNANPNTIPNPVTAPDTVEAAYRTTIEDAIRRGDTTSAGALSAALSQYKAEGWKTVPEDQREYYEVLDGNKVVKVPWYNMEEMILAGTAQQRDYPDGSYDFVIRRPNQVKKEV